MVGATSPFHLWLGGSQRRRQRRLARRYPHRFGELNFERGLLFHQHLPSFGQLALLGCDLLLLLSDSADPIANLLSGPGESKPLILLTLALKLFDVVKGKRRLEPRFQFR